MIISCSISCFLNEAWYSAACPTRNTLQTILLMLETLFGEIAILRLTLSTGCLSLSKAKRNSFANETWCRVPVEGRSRTGIEYLFKRNAYFLFFLYILIPMRSPIAKRINGHTFVKATKNQIKFSQPLLNPLLNFCPKAILSGMVS